MRAAVARPISELTLAVGRLGRGERNLALPTKAAGEIGVLAREFELMAQQLTERQLVLERRNGELEQFAYVSSHDLQEPLRMVASFTQLLAERYGERLDDEAREFIGFAVDGARRMQRLINDLLEYSRVTTRGREFGSVALGRLLEEVVTDLRVAVEESGARVSWGELPTVMGDETQLAQVFRNLISNAIKFRGDEPPVVEITAERRGDEWLVAVRDNGIGVPSEQAERVFVIFQRLHGRTEYPGTGIGLSISKRIVERHGGRVWVEPASPRGSVFYFTLPVNAKEPV
ncbi:MAG: ATP-binding protein [Gemmatimonadales bacterium]